VHLGPRKEALGTAEHPVSPLVYVSCVLCVVCMSVSAPFWVVVTQQICQPTHSRHSKVHHSRATPESQWDETRVLALQGVLRVFKSFAPTLALLENFADAWTRLLKYVSAFATMGSVEVTQVRVARC